MTIVNEIISVMKENGGKCHLDTLYGAIKKYKNDSVRQCLYVYSSDSKYFQGKADLFYCIHGVSARKGVWGLRDNNWENNNAFVSLEKETYNPEKISLDEYIEVLQSKRNTSTKYAGKSEKSNIKIYEGELDESKILSHKRNQIIVKSAKERDNYTCQVCGYNFKNLIVEAHHLTPLSKSGKTAVDVDNLITLCPNCHSLAHILIKYDLIYTKKEVLISGMQKLLENI